MMEHVNQNFLRAKPVRLRTAFKCGDVTWKTGVGRLLKEVFDYGMHVG